jgi:hypothetical protein
MHKKNQSIITVYACINLQCVTAVHCIEDPLIFLVVSVVPNCHIN